MCIRDRERAVGEIRAKYDMERQENEIKQNRLELLEKENKMRFIIFIQFMQNISIKIVNV